MPRLLAWVAVALAAITGIYAAFSTHPAAGQAKNPAQHVSIDPPGGTAGPP